MSSKTKRRRKGWSSGLPWAGAWWLLTGLMAPSGGCASRPAVAPTSAAPAPTADAPRPALSADEAILQKRLREHVKELANNIGERNPEHPWELAEAADYVAQQFEALGYPLERMGYEVDGAAVQNIAVTIPGTAQANEVVIVGAYYDSAPGSRGENSNATGVAALLELARMLQGAETQRTLRLVAFAVCAPPYAGGENMGSLRYARQLEQKPEQVVGMISMDGIGSLSDGPPGRGEGQVRLGATQGAEELRRVLEGEIDAVPLSVQLIAVDTAGKADHWAFAQVGIPAVWVTGAGDDGPIDYDAMARLVMRVRFGLSDIVGEVPTNDGMLTPHMGLVR